MPKSNPDIVGFIFLTDVLEKIILKKPQLDISSLVVPVPVFGLDAGLVGQLILGKDVGDVVVLVAVDPPTVGLEVRVAGTQGQLVVNAGNDAFPGPGAVFRDQAVELNGGLVAVEQGVEGVETGGGRSLAADELKVALGEGRLNRGDVDRLQQLALEQLAHPRDLTPRQGLVGVGQKPVGRKVGRVGVDRVPAFDQSALLEPQVVVNTGQTGASGGQVRVELQFGAVNCPVVVELDRFFHIFQGLHRPVGGLLGDGVVEPGGGVVGVEFLGDGVFTLVQFRALFLVVGLAEVAADEGVVGVEAGGDLDLPSARLEVALADLGQTQTQARQGGGLVEADRLLEGRFGLVYLDLHQVGKSQNVLGQGQIRRQRLGLPGGIEGFAQLAK